MNNDSTGDPINELIEQCVGCGVCSENCRLLKEIGEEPVAIASRGPTVDEAFACSLCSLCEAVCPLYLSPVRMFEQKRAEAVAEGEIDINEYRYLFPDRPVNVMSLFRHQYGIDYHDLNQTVAEDIGFLPGCTMMTYSPALTRKVYETLSEVYPNLVFFADCCGKPLYQLGMQDRGEKNRQHLREKIRRLGVKRLVVACPNCYYEIKKALADQEVELITVYEAINDWKNAYSSNHNHERRATLKAPPVLKCTVHDSCPDRFDGVFGDQVRKALEDADYQVVEMEHNRQTTYCCGSGGQVSHFRPDFADELVECRLAEAEETGAESLIAYCHSCVLNFAKNPSGIKVRHALNILLNFDEDYADVKNKAREMLVGPDGEENWQKIMKEPGEVQSSE